MSSYTFPNLEKYQILYKGRRFIAFSVTKTNPFDGFEDDAEFVVYDGLYDAALSYGVRLPNGFLKGFLAFTHVEIEINESESIKEFVSNSAKAQDRFFKDSGN